jgi:hypothetical protein
VEKLRTPGTKTDLNARMVKFKEVNVMVSELILPKMEHITGVNYRL